MSSLFRILGSVVATIALAGAVAYVADDFGAGLTALFVIPVAILGCAILYGVVIELVAVIRGVPRVGGQLAKTANRGVYAVSGFDIRSAFRRVAQRWKDSK